MTGKGSLRLALLVFTALLGAGLTLGALHAPKPDPAPYDQR
ncbi:MAG TPA: hypothetical protein VEA80_09545 [Vitreimonas sp.]|nr:hypothetical protein [Vitreimonas sp.]HYD87707.1 hypothetical protein [Vitreimonas sp.]